MNFLDRFCIGLDVLIPTLYFSDYFSGSYKLIILVYLQDSPINKQLYAKEIPNYKKLVQEYYKVIKEQPPVSDQDVNAYIAEISRVGLVFTSFGQYVVVDFLLCRIYFLKKIKVQKMYLNVADFEV